MSASETTFLTHSNESAYHKCRRVIRNQATKFRQFQFCLCAIILLVLIMILVAVVSYSLNEIHLNEEISQKNGTFTLKLSMSPNFIPSYHDLSDQELSEMIKAGQLAIIHRHYLDSQATFHPLDEVSPNTRHQNAVKTSLFAGKLALAGVGELGATRYFQSIRKDTDIISRDIYFDGNWAPSGSSCSEYYISRCHDTSKYRTYDGTCNHPENRGAAFTPFSRSLPPDYADGIEAPRVAKSGKALPSARMISLLAHRPVSSSNPSFTVMLAVFGQFLDHDITATALSQGTNGSSLSCCPPDNLEHPECFPVFVGPGDPVYDVAGSKCMEFVRSAPAMQCKLGPRQQLTQVSAFIDGSTIYGSDKSIADSLRDFKDGQLKMYRLANGRTLLPQSTDFNDGCNREVENKRGRYCFLSGDARANENLHLTTMHLLWARQHNFIASELQKINPHWDDERLYQESRRIVGAQMQHITYREFVPVIIGKSETHKRKLVPLESNTYRESSGGDPAIANNFASAAFRFAHTLLPGLMKMTDAEKGTADYIQLHKILFNPYSLYGASGVKSAIISATTNFIQKTSTHVSSQLTRHLFEDPLSNTNYSYNSTHHLPFVPCGLDLVSLNIQRGRDHGLPGYTAWREYCGLIRPRNFLQLKGIVDSDSFEQLPLLYEDVDDVDLYTGALAEIRMSDGLIGPTFTCLISQQFQRLQSGDRYWYESSQSPYPFTPDQLVQLRRSSLAKLICDCSDDIDEIQPLVMQSAGDGNPITLCDDIEAVDFSAWKEAN
ncbi:GSCOCT00003563001.3-RA-CDS [Cotesia congregata]|uniref:Haem peroxidase n=1 Tax=Cotesia congregata TaxID=51543 RepID=A0A8J2MA08_COTCN|nr:GSCOCT00003563001.3-RA-CDS [Cotesia congregata]CAG5077735.1 Haem peroxidase [Cotesia congregata]